MTNSPEATENSMILEQVRTSAQKLLPYAICNIGKPFETPLRWHESRYQGVDESPDFALWTEIGAKSIYLTLGLDISEQNEEILRRQFGRTGDSAVWRLCVSEGTLPDNDGSGSMRALLTIPHEGPIDIKHAQWRKDDEGRGTAVFKRDSHLRERGERSEVKGYLLDTLAEAAEVIPDQQLQFIEEMVANWHIDSDEYLNRNSVRILGSLATRHKLTELGIVF